MQGFAVWRKINFPYSLQAIGTTMRCTMEYTIEELRERLDDYSAGKSGKDELGSWASRTYFDLLKGEFIGLDKLAVYPLIKKLSQLNTPEDDIRDIHPCSHETALDIHSILCGKQDYDFHVEITLSPVIQQMYAQKSEHHTQKSELLRAIRDKVKTRTSDISDAEHDIIRYLDEFEPEQPDTLFGYIDNGIRKICRSLTAKYLRDIATSQLALYTAKSPGQISVYKLHDYIDCYIGARSFGAVISYRKGTCDILLLI